MKNDIHDRLDRARAIARDNMKRASDTMRSGAQSASEQAGKARDGAGRAAAAANRIVTEHPIASAAAAAAAGAIIAMLMPRSRRAIRSAIPKVAAAIMAASKQARDSLPIEEAVGFVDQIARQARQGSIDAVDAAAHRLDQARDVAADGAKAAETRASKLWDSAATGASRITSRLRPPR